MVHDAAFGVDEMAEDIADRARRLQLLQLARLDEAVIGDRAVAGEGADAEHGDVGGGGMADQQRRVAAIGGRGHDYGLAEAEALLQAFLQLYAFDDAVADAELDDALLPRGGEYPVHLDAADTEDLGDPLLRQAFDIVVPGSAGLELGIREARGLLVLDHRHAYASCVR